MFRNNFKILKNISNTGLGDNPEREGWEVFDKNGQPNVKKKGMNASEMFSLYHYLVNISWTRFFSLALLYYIAVNMIFASLYWLIGRYSVDMPMPSDIPPFWNYFFFSTHTLTTVGYGNMYPVGKWMNIVASFEMFWGLLNFAILSGLIYGKFARPKAYVKFSSKILAEIDAEGELESLMFRVIPYKQKAVFSDASIYMVLMIREVIDGNERYRYYPMDAEMSKIKSLTLNWTVVHRVDGDSPLINFKKESLLSDKYQILIYFSAYDEFYANEVKKRHIYNHEDLEFNKKFAPMYTLKDNGMTVLEMDKLDDTIESR